MMSLSWMLRVLSTVLAPHNVLEFKLSVWGPRFGVRTARWATRSTSLVVVQGAACRVYQLEEMEDRYSCLTELTLHKDGSFTMGETEGPTPVHAGGYWEEDDKSGTFVMNMVRTFSTGYDGTGMGKFDYAVERHFVGQVTRVGANFAVAGSIHSVDHVFGD